MYGATYSGFSYKCEWYPAQVHNTFTAECFSLLALLELIPVFDVPNCTLKRRGGGGGTTMGGAGSRTKIRFD